MADVFEGVWGQPRVREFLRASVKAGRVTQAYLFTGPAGSNKTRAAYALAAALLCDKGGCGTCEVCQRVLKGKHPDVRYFAPEGANAYLVEQIRDVVADTSLAPIQANRKIYILDRADQLGAAPANAFLKTLEEPPDDVVIILLARTRDSVLPTILSRCQVVPFRHIPANEAAGILAQNTGASIATAKIAIEACGGSVSRGVEFLKSNERLEFRRRALEAASHLDQCDDWDIICRAKELVGLVNAPLDTVRAAQEAELARNADFLAKSAIRQIEAKNKRALSAKSAESLRQLLAIFASFLRDVLAVCAETPALVINVDVKDQIEEVAASTDEARAGRALACISRASQAISYNVSPETCIDALLFEVREALYGSDSAR